MKVFIIAALTADGYIARNSNEFPDWTSKEDKQSFVHLTKNAALVFGGNTFRAIGKPLPNRKNVVYSRKRLNIEGVKTTQSPPQDLIDELKKEDCESLAICGGSTIYTMFLQSGLVTDVYLTIEPLLFGKGIKLFNTSMDIKLMLTSLKKLNDSTVLLHYKVEA
jgi:dihydrofolate reductase